MSPRTCRFFSRLTFAAVVLAVPMLHAQDPAPAAAPAQTAPDTTSATTFSNTKPAKKTRISKDDRVKETKDTKAALKKDKKTDPLVGKDAQLPDKQLYDKAMAQQKSGHFDVARLDLQTLLNTYPDSQYQMRASWPSLTPGTTRAAAPHSPRLSRSTATSSPSSPTLPRPPRPRCASATST